MAKKPPPALTLYTPGGSFHDAAHRACFALTRSPNTKLAYWNDVRHWLAFCEILDIDPKDPHEDAAALWIESMTREGAAPKTRARRIAGLCSVYRRLAAGRRERIAAWNPFSAEQGLVREKALAVEPTPVAPPEAIGKILATCDDSELGKRDAALIRILWATGARRASVVGMTFERLQQDRGAYIAQLVGKGQKDVRVLIRGKAASALTAWLKVLRDAQLTKGEIWRGKRSVMTARQLDRMLRRRAQIAKIEPVSPHMFRVAFLTYNPAGLEAKQDAAGHADPATTRLYDRASWRGREAFEAMSELEDIKE